MSVQPNVGPVVDAVKVQPEVTAGSSLGDHEAGAIPPRTSEGTVGRHFNIGKILPDGVTGPGNRTQVHSKIRLGIDFVSHQRGNHRAWNGSGIPICGFVSSR